MVYVCDSIMGSGKSMSAITFMNEHQGRRFIYITPYLEEAARIKAGCPDLHFIEPSKKIEKYGWKKIEHTRALIEEGANISTTHQAFIGYKPEMLDTIREMQYTVIIDENINMLERFEIHPDDIKIAEEAGYIKEENGIYSLTGAPYHGDKFNEVFFTMQSRELIHVKDRKDNGYFYWALPPDLITAFKDVYMLTYLFDGQSLHHFLEIYSIPYERIGIHRDEDGTYRFGDYPGYTPDYVYHMRDKIHILDNKKMNEIGDSHYALSMNWFKSGRGNTNELKKNIYNYFRNICRDIPADQKIWGAYKDCVKRLQGKGYTKGFTTFNMRATNDYRNCVSLVYAANVFMNAAEKFFYTSHGISVDEDQYALSIAVQWIWRSAIREGNDVYIYIPSRRMRDIINKWIDSFDAKKEGGDADA